LTHLWKSFRHFLKHFLTLYINILNFYLYVYLRIALAWNWQLYTFNFLTNFEINIMLYTVLSPVFNICSLHLILMFYLLNRLEYYFDYDEAALTFAARRLVSFIFPRGEITIFAWNFPLCCLWKIFKQIVYKVSPLLFYQILFNSCYFF